MSHQYWRDRPHTMAKIRPSHPTASGWIDLLDRWGHGRPPAGNWYGRPATMTADDGDGHEAAWSYTGRPEDAAAVIGGLLLGNQAAIAIWDGRRHVTLCGDGHDDEWRRPIYAADGEIDHYEIIYTPNAAGERVVAI